MAGHTSAAMLRRTPVISEPPSTSAPALSVSVDRDTHAQVGFGAMERMAPLLYVRSYRSLRRKISEKTSASSTSAPASSSFGYPTSSSSASALSASRRQLLRPSYTPHQKAELRRIYSRSLSRPMPATLAVNTTSTRSAGSSSGLLAGSRGVTPSSDSPRTRELTPVTPERQLEWRPAGDAGRGRMTAARLLPLWTPADVTVRDDPLDSEARLAARRQARAEAREIRMRELERQQREAELNGEKLDDFSDVPSRASLSSAGGGGRAGRGASIGSSSVAAGRRGSEESADDGAAAGFHLRDVRHELRELEEKLRKTMVTSAQLDNDKSTLNFQVELLKDKLEELQESHTQLQREHRTRCSEHEQLKRVSNRLREDLDCCRKLLEQRDQLIAENGLVLVGDDEEEDSESSPAAEPAAGAKALVSQSAADLLQKAGSGTLDARLRRLGEEKNELEDQLRRLKLELEEERHANARARISGTGGGADSDAVQREVTRQVGEYRFRLQKADQDITNLQTAVQRLENQVARYKSAAETAEKSEEELKGEKRKLQRELRESLTRVDELETTNSHLQKRLDKLKNARSNLLKDLSTE